MLNGHPAISNFLLYDKEWKKLPKLHRFLEEVKLLKKIRNGGYDLVINLTEGDRGAIAATVSKSKYAVGFDPEGTGMARKKKCYTHIIKHTPKPRHTVEKQLDALRVLGLFPKIDERELTFQIPQNADQKIESLLKENHLEEDQFVHVHPVSRWMFKTIPPKTMAQVLCALHEKGKKVVLTASDDPTEKEMILQIKALAPFAIDLSGKLTLKELGALVKKSEFLVSVDSVPVHIASALKKKVVAIYGPTCEVNWGPYQNPEAKIITQNYPCRPCYQPGCGGCMKSDCLDTISSAQILQEIETL